MPPSNWITHMAEIETMAQILKKKKKKKPKHLYKSLII